MRFNAGKLRWGLMWFPSIEETIAVLEFGAEKYSPDNWKKGLNREEILESTQRHLVALFKGEEIDPESGLPHTAHINCNSMFYAYHKKNNSFTKNRQNPFKVKKK
jgi:hypothetical protein